MTLGLDAVLDYINYNSLMLALIEQGHEFHLSVSKLCYTN